ncbi:MAG: 2Fe-2S iron-sulfur cluster binding domain-containing protein [Gloeomargaritaceae cyanobacterium C42_A2020_066]|nr:2Fe-2S iron-sulfur cluster binding domain-containing protein [Gloeomargaritaceae cyanobacterium C42_A2020_066]
MLPHPPVEVRFLPEDVTVPATPGESLLTVAERAGVVIPTGCRMGSCWACVVDVEDGDPIRSCITAVPAGRPLWTLHLYGDPTWEA